MLQYAIINTSQAEHKVHKTWGEIFGYIYRCVQAKDYDEVQKYIDIIIAHRINRPMKLASNPDAITALYEANPDALNRNLKFLAKSISESDGLKKLAELVQERKEIDGDFEEDTGWFNFF